MVLFQHRTNQWWLLSLSDLDVNRALILLRILFHLNLSVSFVNITLKYAVENYFKKEKVIDAFFLLLVTE